MLAPIPPGFHVYVEAPLAFNVVVCPEHIILLLAVAITVGDRA
jgi:hypothetical protein